MAQTTQTQVLIVGGGVVGLSAALFLRQNGVEVVLVERHPSTSIHPRARGVNGRTMELMRGLGLDAAIVAAGAQLAPALGIHSGENLKAVLDATGQGNWILRRLRRRGLAGQAVKGSPCGPSRCTQDLLEPLLLTAARERGADARLHHQLESFSQDAFGVTAQVLDRSSGERIEVQARYLIAADGARGRTRDLAGITRSQLAPGAHQMNLYFRADMRELVAGREFSMCLVEQPGLRGLFASINNSDLWVLHVSYDPAREGAADFTPERCTDIIRRATGLPQLEIELKGALPWESAAYVADRYRNGRVFVAGDAAHNMPPWGGFGANTGIQDAHNLAWKLAAVLAGRAGDALLDTYENERRPIGLTVSALSASMNDARGLMAIGRSPLQVFWNMRKIFPWLGIGYGYSSDAIVAEPGSPAPGPGTRDLRGRPGTRLPHVWLTRAGVSTLDLVGPRFLLLAAEGGDGWVAAASGMNVHVVQLGRDVTPVSRRSARVFGLGKSGALLVRPDGFIAWRAAAAPDAGAESTLRAVFERVHGGSAATPPATPAGAARLGA